jgi:hypothetical protein
MAPIHADTPSRSVLRLGQACLTCDQGIEFPMFSTFQLHYKGCAVRELSDGSHAPYAEDVSAHARPSGTARNLLLVVAAVVVAEALTCVVLAVLGLVDLDGDSVGTGIGVSLILAIYGGFQAWAAWRVTQGDQWARSPLVVTQIIQLIIAFNLADVPLWITVAVGASAGVTLACLLAPPVTRALGGNPPV